MLRLVILGVLLVGILFGNEYGEQELANIAQREVDKIEKIANSTDSEDEKNIKGFVLSTHIASFTDIGKHVDAEIKKTKKDIELLIKTVARDIELHNGNSGSLVLRDDGTVRYIPKIGIPKALNDKREMLLESNLQNSVSIKSASLAFKLLADINKQIKEKALGAKTKKEKEKLYMKQAIFVYEMSDIVIHLLDRLTLSGKENLQTLYKEAKGKVRDRVKQINSQKEETKALVKNGDLPQNQLEPSLKSLDAMLQAQQTMLKTWESIMQKVGTQERYLTEIKSKNRLLTHYKKGAKLQIETLRDLRTLSGIQESIQSLDALIDSVSSLDLLVLDEKTVSQLLGLDFK